MDFDQLERIVAEEVKKVLAERRRGEETLLPPNQSETLDAAACKGPSCTVPASPSQTASQSNTFLPDQTAILVLFTGAREKWDVLTNAFKGWIDAGIRLDAVFSPSAQYIIPVDDLVSMGFRMVDQPAEISEIMYDMKRYAATFVPSVSRTHAAKLALAITDSVTLNLMLASLAHKVPTIASDDGLAPTACVVCGNHVPGIQEILAKYRDQLATMGMKLNPAEEAVKEVQNIVFNKVESGPDLITSLVTEEDAVKLKGPVVKVSRGGLITPLAMEYFNRQGIEVVIVPQK